MLKEAVFTMKVEYELRQEFMAAAQATHRPASQLIRDFMRDFIRKQRESRDYDLWFRNEVELSLNDKKSKTLSHEQVMEEMKSKLISKLAQEKKREN